MVCSNPLARLVCRSIGSLARNDTRTGSQLLMKLHGIGFIKRLLSVARARFLRPCCRTYCACMQPAYEMAWSSLRTFSQINKLHLLVWLMCMLAVVKVLFFSTHLSCDRSETYIVRFFMRFSLLVSWPKEEPLSQMGVV